MHQSRRPQPLGGQQLQRLRRLREANDTAVHEEHLKRSGGGSTSLYDVQQPVDPLASRTVDAIAQERLQNKGNASTSARLRDKVTVARRGVQSERSERPGDEIRQPERTKTTRKIVAIRRRSGDEEERSSDRRRMGKLEAEWVEKQLQYKTRVATLEKECRTAWQSFFVGAGALTSSTGFVSPAEVNKLLEELETLREDYVYSLKHQLRKLSCKVDDVQVKVEEIANGDQFISELQERIDVMEAALSKFRLEQLQQLEGYVLEEKLLDNELAVFMEKMESWENDTPPRLSRGGASSVSLGSRLARLSKNSSLNLHPVSSRGQLKSNSCDENVNNCNDNQSEDQTVVTGTPDEIGMVNRVRRLNEAILRSGGLKGGWDNREHTTFITLLVNCGLTDDVLLQQYLPEDSKIHFLVHCPSNQDSNHEGDSQNNSRSEYETRVARFLRKCMRKIITQTESSIRSHFEWYLRHLRLVEEKKRVIQDWKMRKEEERQQIIQCGFDADGTDDLDRDETPETISSREQCDRAKLKSREKTERMLEEWKREKKQKEKEKEERRRELQKKRDALEAKRKQEQLDAKQKIILYKLQKEQEAMMLDRTAKRRQDGNTDDLALGPLPTTSPTSNEDLVERSRIAIEYAKAKRLRLQQIEERKQKQQRLPPRPETKTTDEKSNTLPKPAMVLNATEASKARDLTRDEIRRRERRRERQSAHDSYIPGKKAIPDVKFKSFGHIPIQPRAVPAWRKNI